MTSPVGPWFYRPGHLLDFVQVSTACWFEQKEVE